MDSKNQKLLQHYQHDIVNDLDVMYILDELFSRNAISNEDFNYIAFNLTDRVERTRYLLDRLLLYTNSAFEAFVDTLAKDHRWLWVKLATGYTKEMIVESFEDSLSRGDVPRLPEHFVRRSDLERILKTKLSSLTRHKILALHGMSGCGKTVLVTSVLRNNSDLITTNFNGVVYWLNFSNCKTEDDIIVQQNKLYRKASSVSVNKSYMNSSISMSSIGSNADSLTNTDWTWQDLKDRLKSLFSELTLKDALLVLDEVNEKRCLEAFDIGCKILVTTRDTGVVTNFHPDIIKVENYFSEEESLNLFASCLEIPISNLPRQAKKLHDICKGSPFHIALIGAELAENRERLIHDTRHWNYYLNELKKKEFIFSISRPNVDPMKPIEMCINSLKPDILPLFKMLAILPDNVKLSAKVFSKLWNKPIREDINSIIKQLRSKSLIIEFYDKDQANYTYEIHDLIMGYLRSSSNKDEIRKLHGDFLRSYNYDNINNLPVEIEDDGYIAFYIGYHLANTSNFNNMWSLFNRLYLDLKFLGNKVRLTGPADVILDLQKYENHIAHDELDRSLLHSIKEYLSTYGIDLYRYKCTDIIQNVLQNESKGVLYTKAWQAAQERCTKSELYFEFIHEQGVDEIKHSTIDVKEPITAVCFLGDYVLVGTVASVIKFFHIGTNKLKKELQCTQAPIIWIGACPVNPPFISALTGDGVIKLWYIDDVERESNEDIIEEECEESLNNNYPGCVTIAPKLGQFINCRWANNEETLITHTTDMIVLYNTDGVVLHFLDNLARNISCCIPCDLDKYVIAATNTTAKTYSLEIIDVKTKEKQIFEETNRVLDMVTIPGTNRVITLKKKEVTEYQFNVLRRFNQNRSKYVRKAIITNNDVKETVSFISMAVNKNGSLLFVSTDDSRVICVDLKTNTYVFDLENRRGNVVSMSTSEVAWDELARPDVLLTGSAGREDCAKVWYLEPAYVAQRAPSANGKVRLTTKFDVSFINNISPQTPSTATPISAPQSAHNTPKRHQSFVSQRETKPVVKSTMSLDRHSLKPLNLKGICNGNDGAMQPLLAVIDDKNNIQVMRGRKLITEISANIDEHITAIQISPCNQYIIYGLNSGIVKKFTLRSKENRDIMDLNSSVEYMNFVNANLMMVAGKNRCLMAYRLTEDGEWKPKMLQRGNTNLGSQEILNDIQGIKKKSNQSDKISSSDSESSINSRDRLFPNCDLKSRLCKGSSLVDCYWINNTGLITVESNATIKLWDKDLNLTSVLNGRQTDVCVYKSAFKRNVLVLCDDYNLSFQTFELKISDQVKLGIIQEYKLNNRIYSCSLTDDGNLLALGLDSGDVVLWNVHNKRQLKLLKHHKSKVQWCEFSPVPSRLYRAPHSPHPAAPSAHHAPSSLHAPSSHHGPSSLHAPSSPHAHDGDEPPLVLVTMAAEIVWWNITHIIRIRGKEYLRSGLNVITPLASPLDVRNDLSTADNTATNTCNNIFFGSNLFNPQQCWKLHWKKKTFKEGSKRKDILACIKLSGMSAKQICFDEKFSCFVTVDNPGHVHIMKLMDCST